MSAGQDFDAIIAKTVKKLTGESIISILEDAGMIIEASAKDNCPVDTGNLRKSIHTERGQVTETSAEVIIGTGKSAPYDIYVEYGTSRQKAQPYMRPAYDSNKDRVISFIRSEIERLI